MNHTRFIFTLKWIYDCLMKRKGHIYRITIYKSQCPLKFTGIDKKSLFPQDRPNKNKL